MYTSFLLNLLSVSYDVRKDLELVLTYYNAANYGEYARTFGQIVRSITTFDSLATGGLYDKEHALDDEDFADDYDDDELALTAGSSDTAFNKYYDSSKDIFYESDAKKGPPLVFSSVS